MKLDPEVRACFAVDITLDYAADYYPYGKILREYANGEAERFLTTQHERDKETGLDYRGARFYDSDVARFLSLDPLAAEYPGLSDYSYVAGNPVKLVDADGKKIVFPSRTSQLQAQVWLREQGLQNEFRINSHGVLKKKFTPFKRNSEITKGLASATRTNKNIYEVSFSPVDSWVLGVHDRHGDMLVGFVGKGSKVYSTTVSYGMFGSRSVKQIVLTANNLYGFESCEFITAVLGKSAGEKAKKKVGLAEDINTSVEEYQDDANGGMEGTDRNTVNAVLSQTKDDPNDIGVDFNEYSRPVPQLHSNNVLLTDKQMAKILSGLLNSIH